MDDLETRRQWVKQSVCLGCSSRDLDRAFGFRSQQERFIQKFCVKCPVRSPCLQEALRDGEPGVRGGTTEYEYKRFVTLSTVARSRHSSTSRRHSREDEEKFLESNSQEKF